VNRDEPCGGVTTSFTLDTTAFSKIAVSFALYVTVFHISTQKEKRPRLMEKFAPSRLGRPDISQ
jgi:hypothetical protein